MDAAVPLLEVPPPVDEFTVGFGDTVSDGVPSPGAGNIEAPGAVDRYRFEASAEQGAVFDVLTGYTPAGGLPRAEHCVWTRAAEFHRPTRLLRRP